MAKKYQSTVYYKCLKMEDTVRFRVQYLLDVVVNQQLSIHVNQFIRASDTDETSYGAVSGEKHGRTLIKLYVF
jgi:hypothetical protein